MVQSSASPQPKAAPAGTRGSRRTSALRLVAASIAGQLMRRVSFRRVMKMAIRSAMDRGAKGVKIAVAGRLGGAEMARRESFAEGTIPLQTLQAHVDYGFAEAFTTYGAIGVKVFIFKGEILKKDSVAAETL